MRYAVAVESAADIIATINFARQNNIRFVVRNTGHDYNGRSTGVGALSVWTHKLKSVQWKNWNDQYYKGTAVKAGAGIQGYDILEEGLKVKQVVVGGECPTVGSAGGYTQGVAIPLSAPRSVCLPITPWSGNSSPLPAS